MFAIKITAAIAGLTWGVVLLLNCSVLDGCFGLLLSSVFVSGQSLPFSLGPLPMTIDRLLVFVLVALYLIQRFRGRSQPKPLRMCDYILFAFVAVVSISTFTHDYMLTNGSYTAPIYRLVFSYWIPALVYWVARQSTLNNRNLTRFYYMMVALGAYLAVTGLLEVAGQWSFVFPRYVSDPSLGIHFGRARGPMLNAVYLGMYLSVCMFVLGTLARRQSPPAVGMSLVLAFVFALAIYFTYTRSVWLGTLVGIGAVAYFALDLSMRPLMLFATLLIVVILTFLKSDYLIAMEREMSAEETRRSSVGRIITAYVSWQMFKERPLLGHGFGQYPIEKNRFLSNRDTPLPLEQIRTLVNHNSFLSLLTETGAVGLALFMALIVSWVRSAIHILQSGPAWDWAHGHAELMLACLGLYCIQLALHPLSYSQLPNLIVFLMAGITAGLQPMTDADRSNITSFGEIARPRVVTHTDEHLDQREVAVTG